MTLQGFKHPAFTAGDEDKVTYGFFGRQGGVSQPPYDSLNCGLGSNDDPAHISHNRRLVQKELSPAVNALIGPYQIHSSTCVQLHKALWSDENRPKADAVVTTEKNVAISIVTADCTPVLFFGKSGEKTVIGAAHAGWRGAVSGILEATIEAMCATCSDLTPQDIQACVGPCIAQKSYEVGEDFKTKCVAQDPAYTRFFKTVTQNGKPHFDLQGFCHHRLSAAGLTKISTLAMDTYSEEQHFFSYRRATHNGEKPYGRQISAIALM